MPGVVEWFRPGEQVRVERALRHMETIGATHLRTHLSWADFHTEAGAEWYDWLLPFLARHVELLPCVHYTPPSLSETGRSNGPPRELRAYADFIDVVIGRYGNCFDSLELWNEPNNLLDWDWRLDTDWHKFCEMVGAAAYWARERGKRVVLGGPCPNDLNWLKLMGERGVLGTVDALGVHGFPGTWDSEEGLWKNWGSLLGSIRETAAPFNSDLGLWITETGHSTWRGDSSEQARRFLDAIEAPADRLYWYGLEDIPHDIAVQEGLRFDERHYHFGLFRSDGRPKLLARLLTAGGVAGVAETAALARPAIANTRPVLITGGAGFIGSNLADRLMSAGEHVLVVDSLARAGVQKNLHWLNESHGNRLSARLADIRDTAMMNDVVKDCSSVFHLAAQVAVTSSLIDPLDDFEVNLKGTVGLLEAVRRSPVPFVFASTNKVYGDLADIGLELDCETYAPKDEAIRANGISEKRPLDFETPYGCSKGGADQYVLDYARSLGVPATVLRMSCIYGPRQFGTEDQGWVAHFLISALKGEEITIFGDGHQVRDILFVEDAVAAYIGARKHIGAMAGRPFNLGGGPANAVSLVQVLAHIEDLIGRPVHRRFEDWRNGDQRYYVSDTRLLRTALSLPEPIDWQTGIARLARWLEAEDAAAAPLASLSSIQPAMEVRA